MKIDADEKKLSESVERGEWKSAGVGKRERTRYARYARATFRKDRSRPRGQAEGEKQRLKASVPDFATARRWIVGNFAFQKIAIVKDLQQLGDALAQHVIV